MTKTTSRRGDALRRPRSTTPDAARGRGNASPLRKKKAPAPVGAGLKPAPAKPRRKQTFHFSNFRAEDFRTDGLRTYAKYRDLGMSEATSGLLQAHVIRLVPPCDPAVVSKRHYHDVELQMIYVLKGWIKGDYDGEVVTLHQGATWLQPPRIEHRVLDYSDDCELLEIVVPANFKTVELE
jgi:mannose-6-phosphate isomerase-like protein (cupin superfamily)